MDKKITMGIMIILFVGLCLIIGYIAKDFSGAKNIEAVRGSNERCDKMYDYIEDRLDEMNHCSVDSDCDMIMLGGEYIEFGCYHYINKKISKDSIYKLMDIYSERCSEMIDKCAPAPNATCMDGKCVFAG